MSKHSGPSRHLPAAAVLGAAVVAAPTLLATAPAVAAPDRAAERAVDDRIERAIETADALSIAFQHAADAVRPAVVSIRAAKQMKIRRAAPFRFGEGSPFGELFGDDSLRDLNPPADAAPREFWQQGQGSGFIVSAEGHVVTNAHVVDGADEVEVTLSDDRTYTATVVGVDTMTDLAVLRITGEGLEPAALGTSSDLRVGQWVVAAGNPFGLSSSITSGIVSATGRSRVGLADYEDFIQTDAAINPGNSGGPLVNLRGEVVGINTAIFTRSGGNMGIGFAIPIDLAKPIVDRLIEDGRVVRGWLGVVIQDLDEGLAESFGFDDTNGVLVGEVLEDGPAAKSGLRAGDIVLRFDGKRVTGVEGFRFDVASVDPGATVKVQVFRDGKRRTLDVRVGEMNAETAATPGAPAQTEETLGMSVQTLTPQVAARLGLDDTVQGVIVTSVAPLGPAARAGLRPRDVIQSMQDAPVTDARNFSRLLRQHDLEKGVRLVVRSGTTQRFVFLRVNED